MQIKEFISAKPVPSFIAKNKDLLSFIKIDKVFPKIGLPNSRKVIELDNLDIVKNSALTLLHSIYSILNTAVDKLYNYKYYFPNVRITDERNNELWYYGSHISFVADHIYRYTDNCIRIENSKISLKISTDIINNNIYSKNKIDPIFKKDTSIFKAYNKIYEILSELNSEVKIPKLDSIPEFKKFSSDNLPNSKFNVVFSSDNVEGLWDIATMSMRGFRSCQSWDGQYKNNLIGSIADPFCAVIYITTGADCRFGTKMTKRSIVRFVIGENKKPYILIDKMYPEFSQQVLDNFVSFIKDRTSLDVVYGPNLSEKQIQTSYIPHNITSEILKSSTVSYRDTRIPFFNEVNHSTTLDKNIKARQTKFKNILQNTAYKSATTTKISVVVKNKNLQLFCNLVIASPDIWYLVKTYYNNVAIDAMNLFEKKYYQEEFHSSNEYSKKLYFFYLNNKRICSRNEKSQFVKKINEYFKASKEIRFNSRIVSRMLTSVQADVDAKVKCELKKIIAPNAQMKKVVIEA